MINPLNVNIFESLKKLAQEIIVFAALASGRVILKVSKDSSGVTSEVWNWLIAQFQTIYKETNWFNYSYE